MTEYPHAMSCRSVHAGCHSALTISLATLFVLAACGGGTGDPGATARVTMASESAGTHCAAGGARIDAGLDANANGTLDSAEVTSTQYVCNGALGATGGTGAAGSTGATGQAGVTGANGAATLVTLTAVSPGVTCANGGTLVSAGLDSNGNQQLDAGEVTTSQTVCSGPTGATGATGATGSIGATGAAGSNGLNTLMAFAVEAAGTNCTYGGHKITAGLDSSKDGVLDLGEVTSTSYVCDGAPGPGVNWVNVTGTTVQAQSSTGYVANNAAQVTITLPTAPAVGDLIEVSGAGAGGWKLAQNAGQAILSTALPATQASFGTGWAARESNRVWVSVAASADGSKLVAVESGGQIYTSTDSGLNWTARESARPWAGVASSADGNRLVAVAVGEQIYTSVDAGVSWTGRDVARVWVSVASSADGSKLVAIEQGGQIYTSTDAGASWTARDSNRNWFDVASSDDGNKLVAVINGGLIYTSSDAGLNWAPRASSLFWASVASSADGSLLVAAEAGGQLYTSTDSGANWTARDSNRSWRSVASSANGSKLLAVEIAGRIYSSVDAGLTWTAQESTRDWYSAALAADGSKVVAVVNAGQIYIATYDRSTTGTAGSLSGSQYDAIKLQYLGSGLFLPLSYQSYSGSFQVQ